MGPSTEPCGTPETTAFLSDMAPEKYVCWKRFSKYEENQCINIV